MYKGFDISLYRCIIENRPVPDSEIAIVCALWGTSELKNWQLNLPKLLKFQYRGVYQAFRDYVTPEAMAARLVEKMHEAKAHFGGLDFEKYIVGWNPDKTPIYREITVADVPKLVRWYDAVEAAGEKVLVYGSQSKMVLIQNADPAFFQRAELWVAFDDKPITISNFSPSYVDKIHRSFRSVRIAQYDTHLSGEEYGVNFTDPEDRSKDLGVPATTLDGDIYVHEQPITEWLGSGDVISNPGCSPKILTAFSRILELFRQGEK